MQLINHGPIAKFPLRSFIAYHFAKKVIVDIRPFLKSTAPFVVQVRVHQFQQGFCSQLSLSAAQQDYPLTSFNGCKAVKDILRRLFDASLPPKILMWVANTLLPVVHNRGEVSSSQEGWGFLNRDHMD